MAEPLASLLLIFSILFTILNLALLTTAISSCGGTCRTLDDCDGQLICIKGRCSDDPSVGSSTCRTGSSPSRPSGSCRQFSTLNCKGKSYPTFQCSPTVTSSTPAILTNNDFSKGGDGGSPSECDGKFHNNSESVVALSTGWYARGSRCGQRIQIKASNGRSVVAKVVDECDSMNGCDSDHAGQPPCRNNIVDGSDAVWHALGLNIDVGEVKVTWSMA
ncbi:hypothetical protein RJ641_033107 [Dillenia turbinata]|uniref:Kiwellin n=1 Tax=Dillenia turbinata TaxID=194707 RepID=A0AAN8ZFR2_9MAGN